MPKFVARKPEKEVISMRIDSDLLKSIDGKAAAVRDRAEINVKIGDAIFEAGLEIAVAHGQLVEIAEHGHVQFFFRFHGTPHINSAAVRSPRPYDALIIARFYG